MLFWVAFMIKCHLSKLMGERKLKIVDVARATGLNRSTVTALYKEEATRVDIYTINVLCQFFNCDVCDLFQFVNSCEQESNFD